MINFALGKMNLGRLTKKQSQSHLVHLTGIPKTDRDALEDNSLRYGPCDVRKGHHTHAVLNMFHSFFIQAKSLYRRFKISIALEDFFQSFVWVFHGNKHRHVGFSEPQGAKVQIFAIDVDTLCCRFEGLFFAVPRDVEARSPETHVDPSHVLNTVAERPANSHNVQISGRWYPLPHGPMRDKSIAAHNRCNVQKNVEMKSLCRHEEKAIKIVLENGPRSHAHRHLILAIRPRSHTDFLLARVAVGCKDIVHVDVFRLPPYHREYTCSRPITEVKASRAGLVLGWVTVWEYPVS